MTLLSLTQQRYRATPKGREARRRAKRAWRIKHPLYRMWSGMVQRCTNKNHVYFKYYGGRGIGVDPRWLTFAPFEAWILENLGPRPEGLTLDRIDNAGNYEPGNVRWATRAEQQRNSVRNERGQYV